MTSEYGEYEMVNGATANRLQFEVERLQAEPRLSGVAIHDMRYVIEWVLQKVAIPENIERLSLRAIRFLDEYDEAKIAAAAPLTQEEQDRLGL